ncbi:hypothetical protein MZM54_12770 [[Brevibacterium] frigoritolerans]|nr:hypothetical protein [Peribacillus frigoritolerans]
MASLPAQYIFTCTARSNNQDDGGSGHDWFCSPILIPLAQPNVKNETMRRNDWFSNEINPIIPC